MTIGAVGVFAAYRLLFALVGLGIAFGFFVGAVCGVGALYFTAGKGFGVTDVARFFAIFVDQASNALT